MKNTFDDIWRRIKAEAGLKSLKSLADIVEISQPAVSEMKAKNKFPAGWAYMVGKRYGLLTEWIMTGEGPKRLGRNEEDIFFEDLKTWGKEMSGSENIDWMKRQIEAQFPAFKKWKEAKEESERGEDIFPSSKVA